jgi:hypothetical protein
MGVPKKRKKLDRSINGKPKTSQKVDYKDNSQGKDGFNTLFQEQTSSDKLDKALEIIENIDKKITDAEGIMSPHNTVVDNANLPGRKPARTGFRFRISMEAVMPEEYSSRYGEKEKVSISSLFKLDFTIPFLWRLPVIGRFAQFIMS